MKLLSKKILPILAGVYAVLYLMFVLPYIKGDLSTLTPKDLYVLGLFLLFLLGFALSWTNELVGGIILFAWIIGVGILVGHVDRSGGGMVILFTLPIIPLAAFLILQWYKKSRVPRPTKQQQWKFILQVILLYYLQSYIGFVIDNIINRDPINLLSIPGIILPVLMGIFLVGFILSWKHERLAAIVFLTWYGLALFGSVSYFEIYDRGPAFFGFPLLLHGVLYLRLSVNETSLPKAKEPVA